MKSPEEIREQIKELGREEVRERLKDAEENFFGGVRLRDLPSVQEEISLLKWFLKE